MTVRLKRFRRATENNALIPAIVTAVNFFTEYFCFPVKAEGAKGRRLLVPKGTADIIGVHCAHKVRRMVPGSALMSIERLLGLAFAIECKASHRTACLCTSCTAQRGWRLQWEKRGGIYILARSPQEAIDGLMGRRAA